MNFIKVGVLTGEKPKIGTYKSAEQALNRIKSHWDLKFEEIKSEDPDIVLLPEMCTTFCDFIKSDEDDYYNQAMEYFHPYFKDAAKDLGCTIMYSSIRKDENNNKRNSTVTVNEKGDILAVYDKVHPTIWEIEDYHILPGEKAVTKDVGPLKAGYAICFDLNFDELREQYVKDKPDAIFFSSVYHGGLMQKYWAYSTRSYFIGSIYGLESAIISPLGEIIKTTTNYTHHICEYINTDCAVIHLDYNIDKFKSIKEKYKTKIKISDPGLLGSVLIQSDSDDHKIKDIIEEYDLILLDDYLDKARKVQGKKLY